MRKIRPINLKEGDYYIQEWRSDGESLFKKCTQNDIRQKQISGIRLKIINNKTNFSITLNVVGTVEYDTCNFYKLSENEALVRMI